jgi:hypothetical protein
MTILATLRVPHLFAPLRKGGLLRAPKRGRFPFPGNNLSEESQ